MDYDSGELLQILDAKGKAAATFTKSSFKDDVLALTVSGGGTIVLNDVETSTNFNINGTSYKISGSKLVEN